MIKYTLKEGNRVRVVTHNGGVQSQYCEKSYLFGETGIVVGVDPNFADVRIKLEGKEIECIKEVDYRCLKRIDRTFEEIVKELAEKEGYSIALMNSESARLYNKYRFSCSIHNDGSFFINNDDVGLDAESLASISAACSEIAANYEAEHGKEEA